MHACMHCLRRTAWNAIAAKTAPPYQKSARARARATPERPTQPQSRDIVASDRGARAAFRNSAIYIKSISARAAFLFSSLAGAVARRNWAPRAQGFRK